MPGVAEVIWCSKQEAYSFVHLPVERPLCQHMACVPVAFLSRTESSHALGRSRRTSEACISENHPVYSQDPVKVVLL
jgi:hypothetical protein